MKQDAAAAPWLTYARLVTAVDGSEGGDQTAPAAKLHNLLLLHPDLDSALRSQPVNTRKMMIAEAFDLVARTWPTRRTQPSQWLCSGGTQEMLGALHNGSPQAAPDQQAGQSHYGRQIEVSRDPNYRPNFRDQNTWDRLRERALPGFRNLLIRSAGTESGTQ